MYVYMSGFDLLAFISSKLTLHAFLPFHKQPSLPHYLPVVVILIYTVCSSRPSFSFPHDRSWHTPLMNSLERQRGVNTRTHRPRLTERQHSSVSFGEDDVGGSHSPSASRLVSHRERHTFHPSRFAWRVIKTAQSKLTAFLIGLWVIQNNKRTRRRDAN